MIAVDVRAGEIVMVVGVQPNRKVREEVERRVLIGQCLECHAPAMKGRRGKCGHHWNKWYRGLGGLDAQQRAAKEDEEIRKGRILPPRQGFRSDLVKEQGNENAKQSSRVH